MVSEFKVQGPGFSVRGSGVRGQGSGFRVQGTLAAHKHAQYPGLEIGRAVAHPGYTSPTLQATQRGKSKVNLPQMLPLRGSN